MSKEFVPYEEALALKELGFDEYCLADYRQWDGRGEYLHLNEDYSQTHYTVECKAPLYQQAFRFFREEYGLVCGVREVFKGKYAFEITRWEDYSFSSIGVDSCENSEQSCLRKLIEIVKFHPLFVQAIQNQK